MASIGDSSPVGIEQTEEICLYLPAPRANIVARTGRRDELLGLGAIRPQVLAHLAQDPRAAVVRKEYGRHAQGLPGDVCAEGFRMTSVDQLEGPGADYGNGFSVLLSWPPKVTSPPLGWASQE